MKRLLSILLVACMLTASFSGCSNTGSDDETKSPEASDTPSAEETVPEETESTRASIPDDLPANDFGGRDFIVIGTDPDFGKFVSVEELNGEGVNDSVYGRNLTIEERFNAKVGYYNPTGDASKYGEVSTAIKNAVAAGDSDTFHMVSYHVVEAGGVAMQGYFMNWYDIPYINFEKPWWSASTINDLTVNKHCFLAVGDAAVSTISQTYCVIYDKVAASNYNVGDVYSVVREGKWTSDYLTNICATVTTDIDGNGTLDENDYYGLASSPYSPINTYLWAYDNQIFQKNADGEMELVYYNEHLVDIFDKVYALFREADVYAPLDQGHFVGIEKFRNYGSLFCNSLLSFTTTYLTEYENEYGIIPYPKFDENQAVYKTMVDGNHEAMAVAKNATELDFIGIMTEIMCAEAYKQILPAYYDVCLKQRYASSPDDAEMIELCVASRVFDLGYVYDNWKGMSFYLQTLIGAGNKDIASHYKKTGKAAQKYYEKVLKLFTDAE